MKRQTQVPGVRRWYGDDFLELQDEPLEAIDALVGAYNKPCVVSGCTLQNGVLKKGFVALSVQGEALKMMPFDGAAIATPCYLVAQKTSINSIYADGVSRLSAHQYKAVAQTQIPATGVSFLKIEANGKCDRLPDVMQDALHRMVSDSEKTAWNAKEIPGEAQKKATQAKEDAIASANSYTDQASVETRDYTNEKISVKADKTETIVELPSTGNPPDSYYHRLSTWMSVTTPSMRGRYVSFGNTSEDFLLRFSDRDNDNKIGIMIEVQGGANGSRYTPVTLFHTGNLKPDEYVKSTTLKDDYLPIMCAGRRRDNSPSGFEKLKGVTSVVYNNGYYTVHHDYGNYNYIVFATGLNDRPVTVRNKKENSFELHPDGGSSTAGIDFVAFKM